MALSRVKEKGTHWEVRRAGNYNQIGWVRNDDLRGAIVDACGTGKAAISLGCGTGPILGLLRGRFDKLVGVDASQAMLDAGDFKGIETHCMRIEQIPWKSKFDVAEMRNVLHSVENPLQALEVALKVIRPGGKLVLVEGVPPEHRVRATFEKLFEHLEDRHTFSEGDLISLARLAGFTDIRVQPFFMENVDLLDWIKKVAPSAEAAREVEWLHRSADEHFWKVYEMREEKGRLLMTWRFCILTARRPGGKGSRAASKKLGAKRGNARNALKKSK
ncbi:MAG TPA: class I SAM-dependent methyltransferase [Candidatus Thermoplasmatota archaeon]